MQRTTEALITLAQQHSAPDYRKKNMSVKKESQQIPAEEWMVTDFIGI